MTQNGCIYSDAIFLFVFIQWLLLHISSCHNFIGLCARHFCVIHPSVVFEPSLGTKASGVRKGPLSVYTNLTAVTAEVQIGLK